MTKRGFGPGGPGLDPSGAVAFLSCTGAAELASRWPATVDVMRRHTQIDDGVPSACLDLVVEISSTGEVLRVDFEFVEIETLLSDLGHEDAARHCSLDALHRLDATALASQIRDAVEVLMP